MSEQLSLDDAFARGMCGSALAAGKWSADELSAVDGAICTVAHHRDLFTADDVWATLPEGFPVTKGLAGRLNAAVNRGIIANTGSTAFARRGGEHDHRQRLAVWRSLIRGGA